MTHKDKAVLVLKRILEMAQEGRRVTFSNHCGEVVLGIDDQHHHLDPATYNHAPDKDIVEYLYENVRYPIYQENPDAS